MLLQLHKSLMRGSKPSLTECDKAKAEAEAYPRVEAGEPNLVVSAFSTHLTSTRSNTKGVYESRIQLKSFLFMFKIVIQLPQAVKFDHLASTYAQARTPLSLLTKMSGGQEGRSNSCGLWSTRSKAS